MTSAVLSKNGNVKKREKLKIESKNRPRRKNEDNQINYSSSFPLLSPSLVSSSFNFLLTSSYHCDLFLIWRLWFAESCLTTPVRAEAGDDIHCADLPAGNTIFNDAHQHSVLCLCLCTAPPTVQIVHSGHACNVEEERYSERVYTIKEGETLELKCHVTGHPRPQVNECSVST